MSLCRLEKRDGKTIVVDLFSGRRYPSNEEDYILAFAKNNNIHPPEKDEAKAS